MKMTILCPDFTSLSLQDYPWCSDRFVQCEPPSYSTHDSMNKQNRQLVWDRRNKRSGFVPHIKSQGLRYALEFGNYLLERGNSVRSSYYQKQ